MKKKLVIIFVFLILVLGPVVVLAQLGAPSASPDDNSYYTGIPEPTPQNNGSTSSKCPTDISGFKDIICKMSEILNSLIPFLVLLGVLYFVWGVINYVIADEEEAKKKGRDRMVYGIIGLVVIVSLWGLVYIVVDTFGLRNQTVDITQINQPIEEASNQASCTLKTNPRFDHLLNYITCIISRSVIPLIFTLAIATFVYGVVQYVIGADEEKKRTEGKQLMIWGIIALAVMISVWGLVNIFTNTFNIDTKFVPQVKQ